MTLVVYAAGHSQWAAYLNIPHIAGCGELAVLAAGMIGAVVGFLWFNCHPAQVFMGDTGSLPLGGLLGLHGRRRAAGVAAGAGGRGLRGRGRQRHPASRLVQVAEAADLPLRAAAPSFSVPRLAGKQDRRPLLDRRRPVRLLGTACLRINVVEKPAGRSVELVAGGDGPCGEEREKKGT